MLLMFSEWLRLIVGLAVVAFHRPIADFIMEQERALVIAFRQRGVPVPGVPTTATGRNIYFWLGVCIVFIELIRIWGLLHGYRY